MPSAAEVAGAALACAPAVYYYTRIPSPDVRAQVLYSCGVAAFAFATTFRPSRNGVFSQRAWKE